MRVNYVDGNWERLIKRLCTTNFADISAVNRAQLIADAHVLAIDGKLSLAIPIVMISYLTRETDALVWLAVIQHVKNMYFALSQNTRPKYKVNFNFFLIIVPYF